MSTTLNGIGKRIDPLAGLVGRLTEQDRETYAALISYRDSLPAGDEFLRVMELLGLLSLFGQRVPEAMAELLAELRAETKAAVEYHARLDVRLASLPSEIAEGVDVEEIAEAMSEAFRQQITRTGLQDTAALLNTSAKNIKGLSGEIAASLRPVAKEYRSIASTITSDLTRLAEAARKVERHNYRLIEQDRSNRWLWQGCAALTLFLIGGMVGMMFEKRQTSDVLSNIGAQIERIQRPVLPTAPAPRKNKR